MVPVQAKGQEVVLIHIILCIPKSSLSKCWLWLQCANQWVVWLLRQLGGQTVPNSTATKPFESSFCTLPTRVECISLETTSWMLICLNRIIHTSSISIMEVAVARLHAL